MGLLSQDWSKFSGKIDSEDIIVMNVRQQSAAGWFVGVLEFYSPDEADCYSKDSVYYPTEEMCQREHPESISIQEAFADKMMLLRHERKNKKRI